MLVVVRSLAFWSEGGGADTPGTRQGCGGGPLETNLSSYLLKPFANSWVDGCTSLEGARFLSFTLSSAVSSTAVCRWIGTWRARAVGRGESGEL